VQLFVVQSGTVALGSAAFGSCVVVEKDGHLVLVDVGTGSLERLVALSVPLHRIDAVFVTHFHPDHVADLPALIQMFLYGMDPRRTRPLFVVGGPGLTRMFHAWADHFGSFLHPDHGPVRLIEMAAQDHPVIVRCDGLDLGTGRIDALHVDHKEASLAYRFFEAAGQDRGGMSTDACAGCASLVVSGDTGPCDALVEIATGADLFLCECSFPDERPRQGHMTPTPVGEAARRAGVGAVMLTHLYPELDPAEACRRVEALFEGQVAVAEQGLCASFGPRSSASFSPAEGGRVRLARSNRCW